MMCLAAAVVMATPAPSSIAPVPWSQLSRWPPTSRIGAVGIAARHFGDDVARMAAFGFLADQSQMHDDRLAALEDADELLGVRNGQRAGRDRRGAVGEILHAGVRVAVMVGADRADDDRQRALLRGDRRALAARRAELAVARAVLRRHHVMVDEDDLARDRAVGRGAQRIDAVEIDDFAGDALRARSSRCSRARRRPASAGRARRSRRFRRRASTPAW